MRVIWIKLIRLNDQSLKDFQFFIVFTFKYKKYYTRIKNGILVWKGNLMGQLIYSSKIPRSQLRIDK